MLLVAFLVLVALMVVLMIGIVLIVVLMVVPMGVFAAVTNAVKAVVVVEMLNVLKDVRNVVMGARMTVTIHRKNYQMILMQKRK